MGETHPDHESYVWLAGPARVSKAINELIGILKGFRFDGVMNAEETRALTGWQESHRSLARRHPFSEIIPAIDQVLQDGIVTEEEVKDLEWLCEKLSPDADYYQGVTADMQKLHGLLAGIVADRVINNLEIACLSTWLGDNDHLKSCWPYDEIESLIMEIRGKKVVEKPMMDLMLNFLSEFTNVLGKSAVAFPMNEVGQKVTGLCAVCPEVKFLNRTFCFTGASEKITRKGFETIVAKHGGRPHPRVTQAVNYLVVGAAGNPCWAFSCYGRKVEQAIALRKSGLPILIVHENDFWDAYQDHDMRDRGFN